MPAMRVDSIDPPTVLNEVNLDAALKRVVPTWQRCAELASKAGVLMVWEFEPGFAFNKPSEVLRVVNEVGHSNFKILFDTSHAHMSAVVAARHQGQPEQLKGGVIEMIQMLKGKIGHIHLIDSDGTLHNDETSTHRPFGEGQLDFDAIMPVLNQSGCNSAGGSSISASGQGRGKQHPAANSSWIASTRSMDLRPSDRRVERPLWPSTR